MQLIGELIPHCDQALTYTKWTERNCEWESQRVFVLENPDVGVWLCAVGFLWWGRVVTALRENGKQDVDILPFKFDSVVFVTIQAEPQGPGGIQSRGYFLYRVWPCLCQKMKCKKFPWIILWASNNILFAFTATKWKTILRIWVN